MDPVPAEDTPKDVWLRASILLHRPVLSAEPYPHICQAGAQRRDCAACATASAPDRP